jgi:hypothetical protein
MTFDTTHEAYLAALHEIVYHPDFQSAPRGQPIREKVDFLLTIRQPSAEPIQTKDPERNAKIRDYTLKELELYESTTRRAADFAHASKFWEPLSNPDGTINSAYGYLIWADKSCGNPAFENVARSPWEWAKLALLEDKETRQAVLKFNKREHLWRGNKDVPCTMHGIFLIRDDMLNFTICMRSNDYYFGAVYDIPFFCSLLLRMRQQLLPQYPTLKVGAYRHFAHSAHVYERNLPAVLKMLGE